MSKIVTSIAFCLVLFVVLTNAQNDEKPAEPQSLKKTNVRPNNNEPKEPYDNATAAAMALQCVRIETEKGIIEMELFPESAPETVRNFLNLVSISAFDGTTFSRIVPEFIVQGGNVTTRENLSRELSQRARRTIPDEPSLIKHERGIVSMARGDEPNSASSHFFILLGEAAHLDNKFAAFGRVIGGMDVVETINKMPSENEKPAKPVLINRATVFPCAKKSEP